MKHTVCNEDVFILYSRPTIENLLYKAGSPNYFIEKRENTTIVTGGGLTLDIGNPCPPCCD